MTRSARISSLFLLTASAVAAGAGHAAPAAPAPQAVPTPQPGPTPTTPRAPQYKRVHQDILKPLLRGKPEVAKQRLATRLKRDPKDPETWFVQALLHAHAGRTDAAETALATALELGLPRGRALAGPRPLLAGLAQSDLIRKLQAEFAHRPIHGPMLGALTGTSVKIWLRTAQACKVEVLLSAEQPAQAAAKTNAEIRATGQTTAAADFTAVLDVQGLRPATRYVYALRIADGEPIPGGVITTFPALGENGKFRVAFGGGAGYVPENERAWDTIRQKRPDLLLLLGDNIYSDAPKLPELQRYCYYRRQSRPEFRKLVAEVPVFAIYDDHDFGTNDCFYGADVDKPAFKRRVLEVFRQNWANPAYGQDPTPGCFFDFAIGDLYFLMLDGRYHRSDPKGPKPSMLGMAQDAWVKSQLASRLLIRKSALHFVCSPVPWSFEAKGKSLDTWNGFRAERNSLFDFIGGFQLEGVFLLSADRHRTDIWKHVRPKHYPFFEFNSSRLTNQHVHKTMRAAEYSYNAKQSFGLIDIDTTKADPTLELQVVTIDGEVVHRRTIRYSELCYK